MTKPYKEIEFGEFLKILKGKYIGSLASIADALGVDPDTITAWKRTPEARQAIAESIQKSLGEMEKVGAKDWRMWDRRLQMLGVNPAQVVENKNPQDAVETILKGFGLLGSDVRKTEGSPQDPPETNS